MIRLQLSGYPSLSREGTALTGAVTQRHRLALLALLALAPRRSLPRDKVFALLWPDSDTASARHLLNTAVSVIRNAAGEETLISRRDGIALAPHAAVDILEFQERAEGDALSALSLYRAPFLDGFFLEDASEFEQWTSRERARLNALYRGALESAAVAAETAGNIPSAITHWRALTRDDPYNSRAVTHLMLALERTGDHGNALELAREHESLLAKDLEAEPSKEFRDLVRRMRATPNGLSEPMIVPQRDVAASKVIFDVPSRLEPILAGTHGSVRWNPRVLFGGIGTIAILAVAAILIAFGDPTPQNRRVLVIPFENATGDSTLSTLGRVTSAWIVDALTRTGALAVVEARSPGVGSATGSGERASSPPDPVEAARDAGAAFVVTGAFHPNGDSVQFQATVRDAADGRVVSSVPVVTGAIRDPMPSVEQVRSRLAGALSALIDPRLGRATTTITPPLYSAYLEYLAGLEQVQTTNQAHTRFYEAARLDSTFSLAIIWTAYALDRCQNSQLRGFKTMCLSISWDSLVAVVEARRARLSPLERHALDFTKAWRTKDHGLYYESAKAASQLVPVSFWTAHAFFSAIDLGRNEEAMATLLAMRNVPLVDRVFPAYRTHLGDLFHEEGWFNDELNEVRRIDRSPGPLNPPLQILNSRARALAALGMIDSVLQIGATLASTQHGIGSVAGASRELRAHGHVAAADSLARLCTAVVNASQDTTPTGLRNEALCAEARGDVKEARRVFEECCIATNPNPSLVMLLSKLGAFAALAGDTAAAQRYSAVIDTLPISKASNTRWFPKEFLAEKLAAKAMIAAALGDGPGAVTLLQQSFSEWGRRRLVFRHQQLQPEYDPIRSYPPFQRLVASLPRSLPSPGQGSR